MSKVTNLNDESLEKLPTRTKMRRNDFDRYDESHWYYDHYGKQRRIWRYLDRFLEKSVGKSYNKTYSEFIKRVEENKNLGLIIGNFNAKEAFKSYFEDRYRRYDVKNNVIVKNPNRWKSPTPKVKVQDGTTEYYLWKKNNNPADDFDVYNILYVTFGYKKLCHFRRDKIYPGEINKYRNALKFTALDDRGIKFEDLFTPTTIGDIYLEKGDEGYKKAKAEQKEARDKRSRKIDKAYKEKMETLLHDIENAKKVKEQKENLITRDRLGFDDQSFIGEPYHGQKRKKKQ